MSTAKSKQLKRVAAAKATTTRKQRKPRTRITSAETGETLVPKVARSRGRKKLAMMSEHSQQAAFVSWCRKAAEMQENPIVRSALRWTHAIPNGYLRTVAQRLKGSREGVKSGVADILVPCTQLGSTIVSRFLARGFSGSRAALYIEFKVPGNTLSETQREFEIHCKAVGYQHITAYSWQEAARAVVEYLALAPGTYPEIGESEYEVYRRITSKGKGGAKKGK